MSETQKCIVAIEEALRQQRSFAVLTVVSLEGSGYRGPGARMVVDDLGFVSGALSGGCLEGDLQLQAMRCMADGKNRLVRYDTRDDASSVFGLNLGCDGVLQIYIEAFYLSADTTNNFQERTRDTLHLLEKLSQVRHRVMHLLVFESEDPTIPAGYHILINSEQELDSLPISLRDLAIQAWKMGKSYCLHSTSSASGSLAFLCEHCAPQPVLNVVGAGYDAIPLVRMATEIGWRCRVFDKSAVKATAQRFPEAELVNAGSASQCAELLIDGEQSACVLMSHNTEFDAALLRLLLDRDFSFIGILGSRQRAQTLIHTLQSEGSSLSVETLSPLHAPVGLDLGAETAEEIALSIIAEIQASLRQSSAMPLTQKLGRIHDLRTN